MFRRARPSEERRAFEAAAVHVEAAKEALMQSVPAPRREPVPLGEAIHAFERELAEVRSRMDAWRTDATRAVWDRCAEGLDLAARAAERMRLDAPALDFESLVLGLGDLIAPLDAFEEADRALRS